jgi:hypothetical protein
VLAYSAGATALMNTWLFMVHAKLLAYLVMTMLWLSPALLSMLRIRRVKPEDERGACGPHLAHLKPDTRISNIGWSIVLLITGSSLGLLVIAGSTTLLGVFTVGYSIVPWHRIRLCRQRPVWAGLVMCGGGAIVVSIYHRHAQFMFLPIAAWVFGVAALSAFLGTIRKKLPKKQLEKTRPVPVQP